MGGLKEQMPESWKDSDGERERDEKEDGEREEMAGVRFDYPFGCGEDCAWTE